MLYGKLWHAAALHRLCWCFHQQIHSLSKNIAGENTGNGKDIFKHFYKLPFT
jgi:hypothetical protein